MALRNITQALKSITGNLDATKLAAFERDVQGFLPSANKKEFLEVSRQIADAEAFTEPVWTLVQKQYLQRYDQFTSEDTLAFYDIVSRCPLNVYRELDEKLWSSLVYIGKQEVENYAKSDPAFEEKMDTFFQGILTQAFGTVIPMIKDGEDIFTDTTSNVEIVARERRPEDIENRVEEILGLDGADVDNYNDSLEKIWSGQVEDEDEQKALWDKLINPTKDSGIISPNEGTKKIPDSAPARKE